MARGSLFSVLSHKMAFKKINKIKQKANKQNESPRSHLQVYSENYQVPDSAATATAMYTGVKTDSRKLNVDVTSKKGSCDEESARLYGIMSWASAGRKYWKGSKDNV